MKSTASDSLRFEDSRQGSAAAIPTKFEFLHRGHRGPKQRALALERDVSRPAGSGAPQTGEPSALQTSCRTATAT